MIDRMACKLADGRPGVHLPCAGVHVGLLACAWVAQAYRRDIPGFQTDVHACSLMPTKSIQYCRRAAAIESEQQLQRELDLSRGRCGVCDDPARGAVVGALENKLIRAREIGGVQKLEYIHTGMQN